MDNILISIIIPYYNKSASIYRAVNSVINQTYSNWELILIDDRSEVPLKEIFHIDDKRIQILVNHQNLGPGPTRQRGLDIEKGEYVAFLDADDWWEEIFLEKSLAEINSNVAAVWSRTLLIDVKGAQLKRFNDLSHTSILKYLLKYGHPICTSSFLWNKKYLSTWSSLTTQQDSLFEFHNSLICDRILPINLTLVYQDKTGEEHREKYVKKSNNYINKFLVYLYILEKGKLSMLQKTQVLLWFIRLARKLRNLDDKIGYNIIMSEINRKFYLNSYFILRCIDGLLIKTFINIHF